MAVTPEVPGRVAVRELSGRATPAGTPEARLAEEYRRLLPTTEDPLDVLAGRAIPNEQSIRSLVDVNSSTNDENGNPTRTREQRGRKRLGDQLAEIHSRIIEGRDIDGLAAHPVVRQAAETILLQDVVLAAEFNAHTPAEQQNLIANMLRDPKTREVVARALTERVSADKLISDNIEELRRNELAVREQVTSLNTERIQVDTKLTADKLEIAEYETKRSVTAVGGGLVEGKFVQELTRLKSELAPLAAQTESLQTEISALDSRIAVIENQKAQFVGRRGTIATPNGAPTFDETIAQFDSQIQAIQNEKLPKTTQLSGAQRQSAERTQKIEAIEQRKVSLESSIQSAQQRLSEIDAKLGESNPKLAEIQRELNQAVTERMLKEGEFISSLNTILPEAFESTLNDRLRLAREAQAKIEMINVSENARVAQEHIRSLCRGANGEIDYNAFNVEWQTYLQDGPEAIVLAAGNAAGLTPDQVHDNQELYAQLTEMAHRKMVQGRFERPRGGLRGRLRLREPVTRVESFAIMDRIGEDGFKKMLDGNATANNLFKQAQEQGVARGSILESMKKMHLDKILLVLALLFGATALMGLKGA